MNQILVTEKLYVTPELKKKKKFFKVEFLLSLSALICLYSCAIYADYDRNKSEAVSQEILSSIQFQEQTITVEEEAILVVLNEALDDGEEPETVILTNTVELTVPEEQVSVASDGTEYFTIGVINIPKINVNYPIFSETTTELLKTAPCKFWGPNPNEVGNLCIVGHNYRSSKFFSKVPTLEIGDTIEITDLFGRTIVYEIYDRYVVDPSDVNCTSQLTNGKKEVTLITCTNDNSQRVIVKSREI